MRLLDRQRRHALHHDRRQQHALGLAARQHGQCGVAEQHGERVRLVRDGQLPARHVAPVAAQALVYVGQPQPQLAGHERRVEGAHRHAGLERRDQQRVGHQPARLEAAVLQPLDRDLLDRRALLVGVDADLAEEDAVGPRHRLLAHRHRARAVKAVREHRHPLLDDARRVPVGRRDLGDGQPELGELVGQFRGDPALPQRRVLGHLRVIRAIPSARSRSSRLPSLVSATRPPWLAKTVLGQTPIEYRFTTAPS